MAKEDLTDDVRAAASSLRDMARAEPVVAISKGIEKVGRMAKKKTESLWDRNKKGYTTIRELAKAGKPKEGEKDKKKPRAAPRSPTREQIAEGRRKARERAEAEKKKKPPTP